MTAPTVDRAPIEHRLITMRKGIERLESLGALPGSRLRDDPSVGLVLERILWMLDDLACAINNQVSGAACATSGASFRAAHQAGLVDAGLVSTLASLDGPPHLLLQLSLDADADEAAAVVRAARAGYQEYVRRVTGWMSESPRRQEQP